MSNTKNVFIYRQNAASQGAKILARALGIKMIKNSDTTSFTPRTGKTVVNWGSGSEFPFGYGNATIVNHPEQVGKVTNKRTFFEMCKANGGVAIPDFTTRREEARTWIQEGYLLFARTILQGSCGDGIVELNTEEELMRLPEGTLIVKYIKKKHEFRIHVGDGAVISRQQKKRRSVVPLEDVNWKVRNVDNGFIFARNDITIPEKVEEQSLKAMEVSGLDFGAVDVLWNARRGEAYVLEINTAPGLEGSTAVHYAKYLSRKLGLDVSEDLDVHDISTLAAQHGIAINTRSTSPTIPLRSGRVNAHDLNYNANAAEAVQLNMEQVREQVRMSARAAVRPPLTRADVEAAQRMGLAREFDNEDGEE